MDKFAFASTPIYILSDNQFLFLCIALHAVCVSVRVRERCTYLASGRMGWRGVQVACIMPTYLLNSQSHKQAYVPDIEENHTIIIYIIVRSFVFSIKILPNRHLYAD